MHPEYKDVSILPVKITVTNAGVVTAESKNTDKQYKRIVGFAITYDHTENLAGSMINIKIGGKSMFHRAVETALFTFNSSCPVNHRFSNLINEAVDDSPVEFQYTPGAAFPAGNTVITVSFACIKE